MLIINADDWGRDELATDTSLDCHRKQRITSVSAMVFMADSERAASIAQVEGVDAGLHVNFTETFTDRKCSPTLLSKQNRIRRFLKRNKYSLLLFQPFLMSAFREVFEAQLEEFHHLYGCAPSHFDGHQHMHLCSNMLIQRILPNGAKVRRSFSFRSGQKSSLNLAYRNIVDRHLSKRHRITDYFFALESALKAGEPAKIFRDAGEQEVELMTHAWNDMEYQWLTSDLARKYFEGVTLKSYSQL